MDSLYAQQLQSVRNIINKMIGIHRFLIALIVVITVVIVLTILNNNQLTMFKNLGKPSKMLSSSRFQSGYEKSDYYYQKIDGISLSSSQLKLLATEDKTLVKKTFISKTKENSVKTENKEETIQCTRKLPEVLIIGIPKCGTAALQAFLRFHPNISTNMSKELNFFSKNYEMGIDWYRNQLPCSSPNQLTIERSAEYFYKQFVPERVKKMNKKMKLLLNVCEPVRRTISHFAMFQAVGYVSPNITAERYFLKPKTLPGVFGLRVKSDNKSAENVIMVISDYVRHFSSWLRYFPLKQFHLIDGDNLSRDPYTEISAVEKFLGIGQYIRKENFIYNATKGFYCYNKRLTNGGGKVKVDDSSNDKYVRCLVPSKGRKHPDIDEKVISWMKSIFKSSNKKFFKIVNRNFDW